MLTIKAKRSRKSRRYITKLGSDQHPNSNSAGKSWDTAHLETQWGKGPRQHVTISWVRLQRLQFQVPPYNPRMLSVIISNLWANSTSVFLLMLFVCLTKPIMLLSLGMSRPGPLQGLNNLKICPLSYLWCCKPCTHSRQSGQCPARLEASSEACFREDLDPVPPALLGVESHLFCQPRSDGHYRWTEKYSQINLLSASFWMHRKQYNIQYNTDNWASTGLKGKVSACHAGDVG